MKKILISLALCGCLVISCGKSGNDTVTIEWWQFWTDTGIKPVVERIVSDFEAVHPGVDVQLVDLTWADGHDKVAIAFSSGSGPDVVELGSDWILEFSSTGHLLDMTEATAFQRESYRMWEPGMYDGQYFAFPWILGTRVLCINRELLARAGYSPEYFPGYWGEFLTMAMRIDALGEDIHGFGSNSAERHRLYKKFLPFMWSNGGSILSSDGETCLLDSEENVKALEYYMSLCQTGLTDTQRRLEDEFLNGTIGCVISGDWLLKRIAKEKPEFALTTCPIPYPDEKSVSVSFAGGEYLSINARTRHPEIALELVKFICSPEQQLRFCRQNETPTPASIIAASDSAFISQPHYSTFIDQLQTSRMPPAHPKWVYIEAALEKAIEKALYEAASPRESLTHATTMINEILAQ